MVIDSNTLLSGEEYVPLVGFEYQIAPSLRVKMPEPTQRLAEDAQAKLMEWHEIDESERTYEGQLAIAELIAGKPFGDPKNTIAPVVQVYMLDFFSIGRRIMDALGTYAERLNPSE